MGLGDSGNRVDGSGAGVDGSAASRPNRVWSSHESLDDPSASSEFARNSGSSLSRSFRFVKYSGVRVQCLWWIWIVGYRCVASYRKSVFGDDATRAASTRAVLRRRLGFVRGAGGLRNRFTGARGTDAAPNISSVAARRAEAVDGSMMGCSCYSTASVVGRDTGRVDWISSTRRSVRLR